MDRHNTKITTPYPSSKRRGLVVAIALSGGVDSACAAALLKKQGYRVVAFFMKNWSDTFGLKESECPWVQDRQDAMRVAAKLDIPFHTLDFEKEYKREVLDYFFREYKAGRTPNPDVLCNSQIKFGVFLERAMELGADYITTGHYARTSFVIPSGVSRSETEPLYLVNPHIRDSSVASRPRNDIELLQAKDKNKDQTYFLHRLTQAQLARAIFPIGDYSKPQVRALAKKFGLPNWNKKGSSGLCFVGHVRLKQFLSQKIKERPGDIVWIPRQNSPRTGFGARDDKRADEKVIGRHQGLFWYTIGQRQGIGIGGIGPFYVLEKDFRHNRLIVTSEREDKRFWKKEVESTGANWIGGAELTFPLRCQGRIRYREPLVECEVVKVCHPEESPVAIGEGERRGISGASWRDSSVASRPRNDKSKYRATFTKPVWAPAPGQSIVFYKGEACLGGGIIA